MCAMSPRLLRPIASGVHPEAADWRARVIANGGTVSGSTLQAVSRLCTSISSAGIRDRFYRLGIFAGDNLNAALVPLYRGPTFGGTTYGNTVDQSLGSPSFVGVGTDYAETGANGGLTGNGTSKYLNTGLSLDNMGITLSGHISVYHSQPTGSNVNRALIGTNIAGGTSRNFLESNLFSSSAVSAFYGGIINATETGVGSQTGAPAGHRVLSRESSSSLTHYRNGSVVVGPITTDSTGGTASHANAFYVFAINNAGTAVAFGNQRSMAYSIGDGMTPAQVSAYYTAMQAFQAALGRNV